MHPKQAKLSHPLNIDVSKIASFFPEFGYRGPFEDETSEFIMNLDYLDNMDKFQDKFKVLLFDDKTKNGFIKITSDYSPEELAFLFTRLPEELAQPLKNSLKGTPLEIPNLSPAMLARYKNEREEEQKKEAEFKKLQKPLKNAKYVDFQAHQAVTVLQHEYALTTADSDKPVLGTFGARPCLILALYDESRKTAILAHIDAQTDIDSLNPLFHKLSREHTVAHLAGGVSSSKNMCLSVVEMLQRNNIQIVNVDSCDSASLAIDSRTGAIYSPVLVYDLEQTADLYLRLQMVEFEKSPITEYYNSLKQVKTPHQSSMKQIYSALGIPSNIESKSLGCDKNLLEPISSRTRSSMLSLKTEAAKKEPKSPSFSTPKKRKRSRLAI